MSPMKKYWRRNDLSSLCGDGNYDPSPEGSKATFSFSAVFAEVHVDPDLGLVRLNRFVGAYDCGRVINPKTARSQAIGGIIWGVGQALLERTETDPTLGRFLNRNYSGYLVPTCADIPELDVLFVGEFDEEASPIGGKGLGELASVSVAPAIANAVYHATGKRVRDLADHHREAVVRRRRHCFVRHERELRGIEMAPFSDNPFAALTIVVAPAILTNASSVLCLGTANRLARVVDRTRVVSAELANAAPNTRNLCGLPDINCRTSERAGPLFSGR